MEPNSESSIIQRALQGDQEAISRLYNETKNYAYFVARRYLKNDEDVADALQEAYISVFSKLDTFEDGRPFKPWLHTIVTNKCLNFIKSKRAVFVSVDDIAELVGDDEELIPASWLERAEKRRDIIRIIDGLSEGQRMAVTLFYFEGLSISEMAGIMGVAEGTVKAHLYYGRKNIKEEVLREEKKGNKLYAIVPLPLLTQLFELEAETAVMPEAMSKAIWEGTINGLTANGVIAGANTPAAGSAVEGVAGGAGTPTATGLAAKIAAMSVTAKIIAVAVIAVVVAAGIIIGSTLSRLSDPALPAAQTGGTDSSVPTATDESTESDATNSNYAEGDIITFGTYDGEPIEWRVLDVSDGKTLIITERVVEKRIYYGYFADKDGDGFVFEASDEFNAAGGAEAFNCTWETSDIRSWLNGEFYTSAFSPSEQSKIIQTTISTPDNSAYGTSGGNDTSDMLFLLSVEELFNYFAGKSIQAMYKPDVRGSAELPSEWWLRSPGSVQHSATNVLDENTVVQGDSGIYVSNTLGVRPALWLDNPGTTKAEADFALAYK